MLEKVQAMLADALGVSADKITPDARIIEDLGADSLDVVELLSRLEDEYGITIPEDDVENLKTVGDIVTELEKISNKSFCRRFRDKKRGNGQMGIMFWLFITGFVCFAYAGQFCF